MTTRHEDHHFSITIHTDDLAVVYVLRALSQFCQRTGNARIPWGGTKKEDWIRASHHVTFHFSEPQYREKFRTEIQRLLPIASLKIVAEDDDDPADRLV